MSNEDQAPDSEAQTAEAHDAEGTAGVATTSDALGVAQAATEQAPRGDRDDQDAAVPTEATRGAAASRDGVSRVLAMLALLVALAAAAASGFLFWQYRQFYVALDEADQGATQALQRVRIEQRSLRDELAQLTSEQAAVNRALAAQNAEIGSLPPRFAELENRLTALQGVSADARRRWLRAEIERRVLRLHEGKSRHFKNRRIKIVTDDRFIRYRSRLTMPRPFNDTGDTNPSFVKPAFRSTQRQD